MITLRTSSVLLVLTVIVLMGVVTGASLQAATVTENFDTEPTTWWGQENRDAPNNFGWSDTNYAEGVLGAGVGEIGGLFSRINAAAYWTDVDSLDLSTDSLLLSGRGCFINGWESDGNSILGWFDSTSSLSWVPDNYIAIRTDTNDVYLEYAANGSDPHNVKIDGPLPGIEEEEGVSWTFALNYDPTGNGGKGVVTASINDGTPVVLNLAPGDKDAMADLDRFGLLTLANAQTNVKEVYYDDLTYTFNGYGGPMIPGDATLDGKVDAADAAILAANWLSQNAEWGQGDFNDDGKVDDVDATLLASNWQTAAGSAASVPEPAVLTGLVLLLSMLPMFRRRQAL